MTSVGGWKNLFWVGLEKRKKFLKDGEIEKALTDKYQ